MLSSVMQRSSAGNLLNLPVILPPPTGLPIGTDAEQRKRLDQLATAVTWASGKKLYIGEFGVPVNDPNSSSQASQLDLHRTWLQALNYYGIHATGWSSGAWMGGTDFTQAKQGVTAYFYNGQTNGSINTKSPIAQQIIDYKKSGLIRGTNISGLDWNGGRNTQVSGYIPNQTELNFMAASGLETIRLVGSWEAYYPTLDGPLDQTAVTRLFDLIKRCAVANIKVILDCNHRSLRYMKADGTELVMRPTKGELTSHHLSDFWVKMSAAIKADSVVNQTVIALDLANEPYLLPGEDNSDTASPTKVVYGFNGSVEGWTTNSGNLIRYSNNAAESYRTSWSTWSNNYFKFINTAPLSLLPAPGYVGTVEVTVTLSSPQSGGAGQAQLLIYDSTGALKSSGKVGVPKGGTSVKFQLPSTYIARPNQLQILIDTIDKTKIADGDAYRLTSLSVKGLGDVTVINGPKSLEIITQDCVSALRSAGETRTLAIPTYNYSQLNRVVTSHPDGPWITDSANNFWYELHSYWDQAGTGQYKLGSGTDTSVEPYSVALQQAIDDGYGDGPPPPAALAGPGTVGCRIPRSQLIRTTPAEAATLDDLSGRLITGPLIINKNMVGTDFIIEARENTTYLVDRRAGTAQFNYVTVSGLELDDNDRPVRAHQINAGAGGSNITLKRADIMYTNDGFRISSNCFLLESYIHAHTIDYDDANGAEQHRDGTQSIGATNITIEDCLYDNRQVASPFASGTWIGTTSKSASSSYIMNHDNPYPGWIRFNRNRSIGGSSVHVNMPGGLDAGDYTDWYYPVYNQAGALVRGFECKDNLSLEDPQYAMLITDSQFKNFGFVSATNRRTLSDGTTGPWTVINYGTTASDPKMIDSDGSNLLQRTKSISSSQSFGLANVSGTNFTIKYLVGRTGIVLGQATTLNPTLINFSGLTLANVPNNIVSIRCEYSYTDSSGAAKTDIFYTPIKLTA